MYLGIAHPCSDLFLYGNDPYHLHPAKLQEHRQLPNATQRIAELRDDQFVTSFQTIHELLPFRACLLLACTIFYDTAIAILLHPSPVKGECVCSELNM